MSLTLLTALTLGLLAGNPSTAELESTCTEALKPELPKAAVQWSKLEVEVLYRFAEVRGQLELTGRLPSFDESMPDVTVRSYFACQIDHWSVSLTRSDEPIRSFADRLEDGEALFFKRAAGKGFAIKGPAPLVTAKEVSCAQLGLNPIGLAVGKTVPYFRLTGDEPPDYADISQRLSTQARELAEMDWSDCTSPVRKALKDVEAALADRPPESREELVERKETLFDAMHHHREMVDLVLRAAGKKFN